MRCWHSISAIDHTSIDGAACAETKSDESDKRTKFLPHMLHKKALIIENQ